MKKIHNRFTQKQGTQNTAKYEHKFIELYLDDEEIMAIALACSRSKNIIRTQTYFAHAKQEQSKCKLEVLSEIVDRKLKIKGFKLGVPIFELVDSQSNYIN